MGTRMLEGGGTVHEWGHEYSNGEVPSTNGDTNARRGRSRPRMGTRMLEWGGTVHEWGTNARMGEAVVREFVRNSWMGFSIGKNRPRMGTRMLECVRRLFVNS
ncbi:MAG: hypothetical protein PGMFKBFP_00798 [Anaerolineales bacterium]|nr:hypothetical protein [Anaerolineales bacterium]